MPITRRPRPAEQRARLEARRLQAAELFAQGRTQAEVANTLGVSRQSAHVWHTRFQEGGVDALRSRGPTGPDPKLSAAQLAKVEQALLAGAMANGFDTDLWTLERVAVVITQLTGGPSVACACAIMRSTSSALATSPLHRQALPPAASICWRTPSAAASSSR